MPALAGEERLDGDRHAGAPQAADRRQQAGEITLAVAGVGERGENGRRPSPLRMLAGESAQGAARADLEQRTRTVGEQGGEAVGEANGPPQVAHPVVGGGGLLGAQPAAGDVGQHRNPRRPQGEAGHHLAERRQDGVDRRRVEGVGGGQRAGRHAACPEAGEEAGHRRRLARHHRRLGAVDRRQRQRGDGIALAPVIPNDLADATDLRQHRLRRHRHGGHRAGRQRAHQPATGGDQGEGVLEGEDTGQTGGGQLAQRVAEERRRFDPPALPQPRQRQLHREQRRLRQLGGDEAGFGGGAGVVAGPGRREEHPAQVGTQLRSQRLGAAVQFAAEHRFGGVQLGRHAHELHPLAGEEKRHRRARRRSPGGAQPAAPGGPQPLGAVGGAATDHRPPLDQLPPADGEGVGDVGQGAVVARLGAATAAPRRPRTAAADPVGPALQALGEALRRRRQRLRRPPRDQQQVDRPRLPGRRRRRRRFEDGVGVGAADAERADPGAARAGPLRPRLGRGSGTWNGLGGEVDLRVGGGEVEAGRDLAALDGQRRLDQAGHAGGGVEVADVGLHRSQGAEAAPLGQRPEGPGEAGHLDRVAQRSAGAVGLDVAHRLDLVAADAGGGQRVGDHPRLALLAGGGEPGLVGAVVVDRRAAEDGADGIAVGDRVGQALQDDHPHPAPRHHAAGAGVEGAGVAVHRVDAALDRQVAAHLLELRRGAAGQRQVALAGGEGAAGEVDRHQRGRAGGLDGEAGSLEIELEGDPGGDVVDLIGEADGEAAHRRHPLRIGEQAGAVAVVADPGEDAGAAGEALGVVAGVLERRPGGLEEEALLRVGHLRLAGREAEEGGVEAVGVVEGAAGADQARVGEPLRLDADGQQLLVGEDADPFDAVAEQAPEGGDVGRSRKASRHPDDRHGGGGGAGRGEGDGRRPRRRHRRHGPRRPPVATPRSIPGAGPRAPPPSGGGTARPSGRGGRAPAPAGRARGSAAGSGRRGRRSCRRGPPARSPVPRTRVRR